MPDDAWIAAIHESAHGVVARVLRVPAGEASIAGDAYAVFSHGHHEASVMALMAGMCAEIALLGVHDEAGAAYDKEQWEQQVERHGLDGEELWRRTIAIVRSCQPVIEFLAGMLLRAQTLDGASIDRIVGV